MSGSDVLMFVGATTLVAAIVTLFAFQMTSAKLERRMSRRSRTLEGPVPGRRSLSTIGLNTESARNTPRSSAPIARQPGASVGLATDAAKELGPSALPVPPTAPLSKDPELISLQTIRARSASLETDAPPEQPTVPSPVTPAGTPPVQRLPKRPVSESEQDQGPATPRPKTRSQKAGGTASVSRSSAPAAETAEPTNATKAPASRRAKRAIAQDSPDALADLASLDLLNALQPSEIGQDGGLPDIYAGLNEAEPGIQGLTDDLSDIDGGGLPGTAPRTPQKSRR